jgi:succinate-acetate transporter protein
MSPLSKDHENGANRREDVINSGFPSLHNGDTPNEEAMQKIRTANSISISPELFEKMYLNPHNEVKGGLRATFGNPTPLALIGFLLSISPLSCQMMDWRGSGGGDDAGIASVGSYYFMGGLLMTLGGILEFFLGNTFSFVVFCSFGGFWFSLGSTLTPAFNAFSTYTTDERGLLDRDFRASFAFFLLFMGVLSLLYLICALRTNITFVAIFFGLFMTFVLLAGSYWQFALGHGGIALKLQIASGAFGFMACIAGWWIFLAQMLASVDFPFQLPVGDISHVIKGGSDRVKKREQFSA